MSNSAEHLIERAARRLQGAGEIGAWQSQPVAHDTAPAPDAAAPAPIAPVPDVAPVTAAPGLHAFPLAPLAPSELPILQLSTLERAGLVIGGPKRSRISEEYQIVSAQVMRRLQTPRHGSLPGNLVMVTSTKPGEGKSFTALNLAAALARNRRMKTLLIDGDPKQDSLSVQLGVSDRRGLFDLAGPDPQPVGALMLPTFIDGLSILPIGTIVGAHETTHRIAAALDELARNLVDTVLIIDAPPCLSTSDASSISPKVSHIVMVVEAQRTQRRDLEHALDLLSACPSIALVLNKMRSGAFNEFGAYGYYGG